MTALQRTHFGIVALTMMLVLGLLANVAAAQTAIGEPSEGEPVDGGEWIVGIVELPDTLDPHKTGAAVTQRILRNVCDPLIAKDFTGQYVSGLAREWTISEDGLTWTFSLRDDVTFQDGTPFNAQAVKVNFDRILDPATQSALAAGALGPLVSSTVIDDYTFQFTLSEPFAPLLDNLTNSGILCMMSPDAIATMGDEIGRTPVSTGPYSVQEYRSGDRVILKRNPN